MFRGAYASSKYLRLVPLSTCGRASGTQALSAGVPSFSSSAVAATARRLIFAEAAATKAISSHSPSALLFAPHSAFSTASASGSSAAATAAEKSSPAAAAAGTSSTSSTSSSSSSSGGSDNVTSSAASYWSKQHTSKPFKLSAAFLEPFKTKPPPFGFNGLGELVYRRTYARFKDEKYQATEEWWETVERVVTGCYNMQKRWIDQHQLGRSEAGGSRKQTRS